MLSKRIFVLVSLLLVSFLLVGCGLTTPPVVGNEAPGITSTAKTEATVGVEYTYDVDAYDPDGDALTYSLIRNPSGMEIDEDTGLITWTPNSAGSFGVTVKVSDGVLSATQPFTITITPVAELTEIVVTPDEMRLEVGETGYFIVTAHYNDDTTKDVTPDTDCVYTLPTAGVITVTAGSVTAVGVGTDTIFISYTENGVTATANISVTVSRVRIPMTITVDLPTFTVGGPYWFTVKMLANDDSGKSVVASFGWPTSVGGEKIAGTLETDVVSDVNFTLIDENVFQTDPFAMGDTTTVNFRGTFDEVGTYETTIEVKTYPGDVLLCSEVISIVVEAVKVGNSHEGGIVAYIFQSEDPGYVEGETHGLIAAIEDQSEGIAWAIPEHETTEVTGTLLTIGSGSANTDKIIAQNGAGNTYAAGLARAYNGGGFNDWFLPSKDELNQLWINRVVIGSFDTTTEYWSSSEYSAVRAWEQVFNDGGQQPNYLKSSAYPIRAVRTF